jgi:hypothetical protein
LRDLDRDLGQWRQFQLVAGGSSVQLGIQLVTGQAIGA